MNRQLIVCNVVLAAGLLAAIPLFAASNQAKTSAPSKSSASHRESRPSETAGDEGDRVFQQNCARCHNAPNGFSQRISGTIVRHMRIRANLSQHDAQALRRYFNP